MALIILEPAVHHPTMRNSCVAAVLARIFPQSAWLDGTLHVHPPSQQAVDVPDVTT